MLYPLPYSLPKILAAAVTVSVAAAVFLAATPATKKEVDDVFALAVVDGARVRDDALIRGEVESVHCRVDRAAALFRTSVGSSVEALPRSSNIHIPPLRERCKNGQGRHN